MSDLISEKCNYGKDIKVLNAPERVFFITQEVECEVNNGGFDQFFWNSSGNFSYEMEKAFITIGALHTAEICKKALSVFKKPVPVDWFTRQDYLLTMREDNWETVWEKCDEEFYEYHDNLVILNYEFIQKNITFFPSIS